MARWTTRSTQPPRKQARLRLNILAKCALEPARHPSGYEVSPNWFIVLISLVSGHKRELTGFGLVLQRFSCSRRPTPESERSTME